MTVKTDFSDEELTAYLDGEQDFAPVEAIGAALRADPRLQQRADALRLRPGEIKQAFDQLLIKAPVPQLAYAPSLDAASPAWTHAGFRQAIAAALLLAMGAAGGHYLTRAPLDGWREYVAAYQTLYVGETIANISRSEDEAAAELGRATAAVGKPVALAALTADTALTYKRAQILGYKKQPLVQLSFLSKAGEPIALCIMRAKAGAATEPPAYAERQGLASASWSQGGYDYLLIGGTDRSMLEQAAKRLSEAI
jgi:anti-sigma factor RsiW